MRLLSVMSAVALFALDARASMAFHYRTPLTGGELAWYGRFDMLVTHDPLPRAQVEALHARGTRLLLYEWSVAFYRSRATRFDRTLPPAALLNPEPLRGHLGSPAADAFYYDPAWRPKERAAALAAKLRELGYDGVFLDTTTSQSVHPDALAAYARRHPGLSYDAAFGRFLKALRRELKHGLIATNQGYRAARDILPYVDVDVTESLITRPVNGRFVTRPWDDPHDPWNSTAYLMRKLIGPAKRRYPRVTFVHLNYLDVLDERAVAKIVGVARGFGADAFVTTPDLTTAFETHVYFEK